MDTENLFEDIHHACCMGPSNEMCACTHLEMVLHRYSAGDSLRAMTSSERDYLVADADRCAEGALKEDELQAMSDRELAHATLRAWLDYARSNCGL
jgi:hypothetical protein